MYIKRSLFLGLFFVVNTVCSTTLIIPPDSDIVGEVQYIHPEDGETLAEVGVRYDMGYEEMVHANPRIDPISPLQAQQTILVPSQFILPKVPHQGLVINLAEYRLYFFPENENVVMTFPVGIGRKGWNTPLGKTKVVAKQVNPTWRPTATVQAHASRRGVLIPDELPAGSANPLGKHVLRLGWPTYLIHGTNHPEGIGERVSAGCIRLLSEDIEFLFDWVKIGTQVHVVNQPVKLGELNHALYLEAHPMLSGYRVVDWQSQFDEQISRKRLDKHTITQEVSFASGVPTKIT